MDKYKDQRCSKCGQPRPVINPAWMRETRLHAGFTVRGLALEWGYTASYISGMELGRIKVPEEIERKYEQLEG